MGLSRDDFQIVKCHWSSQISPQPMLIDPLLPAIYPSALDDTQTSSPIIIYPQYRVCTSAPISIQNNFFFYNSHNNDSSSVKSQKQMGEQTNKVIHKVKVN